MLVTACVEILIRRGEKNVLFALNDVISFNLSRFREQRDKK